MTFSAFLFVVYLVVLVLALASSSWVAHLRPAPLEAQRVTDAVQHAGRSQLGTTWAPAAATLTLVGGVALWIAPDGALCTTIFAAMPLGGGLCAAFVAVTVSRQLSRVAGQLVGAKSADTVTSLSGRSALSATLTAAAAAGALVTGIETLAHDRLSPEDSSRLALIAVAAGALLLAVFGRALAVAWSAAEHGVTPGQEEDLAAGTLARLVGATFGAGILRAAVLFTAVGLGQLALSSALRPADAMHQHIVWYAQLVLPLGLFAAAFGALAFRSSAREPSSWAWVRGSGVALLILIVGTWSLSGLVGQPELKTVLPASVTFLVLGLALAAFLGGLSWAASDPGTDPPVAGQIFSPSRTVAPLLTWLLPLLLALALLGGASDEDLPARVLTPVLLAAILALLPLLVLLQTAADTAAASILCQVLATEGQPLPGRLAVEVVPPPALRLVAPAVVPLAVLSSVDLLWTDGGSAPVVPWVAATGTLIGALSMLQLSAATSRLAQRGARSLKGLSRAHQRQPELLAPLGAALDAARLAGSQEQWLWIAALILPPSAIATLRPLESGAHLDGLSGGYLLGVVGAATLLSLRLETGPSGGARPLSGLAVPCALAVLSWTLCVFLIFSN